MDANHQMSASARLARSVRTALAAACLLLLVAGPAPAQSSDQKLYFPPCADFAESYTFDCYHDYDEVTEFVRHAAEA